MHSDVLPAFKDYAVDEKQKKFRKATLSSDGRLTVKAIPFDSKEGKRLLKQMMR